MIRISQCDDNARIICEANIGDLCIVTNRSVYVRNKHTVFSDRPEKAELNEFLTAKIPYAIDYVSADKEMFMLLEINQTGKTCYPKIITKEGNVGYLYLHDEFDMIIKATEDTQENSEL